MLSIQAMGGGQENYYANLAREDYYLHGGEPPGQWWGRGAEHLNLGDRVEREQLSNLFRGVDFDGEKLVQNAGRDDRQPGWDLTFSAPKSVSVLWSVADDVTRRTIQQAHYEAVKAALAYLETEHSFTRRGKGGSSREHAGLCVATFEHGTSRALDPDLHTHCLVMNIAVRNDRTTGSLLSKPFFDAQLAAGAVYRDDFAARLSKLGFTCIPDREFFAIEGVPTDLCRQQSKRRVAIEKELGALGLESASAAAFAALKTRDQKGVVPPRRELFERWRPEAAAFGFTPEHAHRLRKMQPTREAAEPSRSVPVDEPSSVSGPHNKTQATDGKRPKRSAVTPNLNDPTLRAAFRTALKSLTEKHAHFSSHDVIRETTLALAPAVHTTATVAAFVRRTLDQSPLVTPLGERNGEARYTTKRMLDLERKLLQLVDRSLQNRHHVASQRHVDAVIKKYSAPRSVLLEEAKHHLRQFKRAARKQRTERIDRSKLAAQARRTLTPEQVEAIRHLTRTPGNIKVLSGRAGTGKTATLRACREIWEHEGFTVMGLSLASRTAKRLQTATGIPSDSIAMLLARMDPSVKYRVKHFTRQLFEATFLRKTMRSLDTLRLDHKTVLVVDEAGMVGTRLMAKLVKATQKAGALLVLAGDDRQLQPLEAGGPLPAIARRTGQAELKTITRQQNTEDRRLVNAMYDGHAKQVLAELASRGRYVVVNTRTETLKAVAHAWAAREAKDPSHAFILCGSRAEVAAMNRRCQELRLRDRHIQADKRLKLRDGYIHVGDQVMLLQTSRKLDVQNGTVGTVIGVQPIMRQLTLRTDEGQTVVVPLRNYTIRSGERKGDVAVDLAYATTVHKGQGASMQRAYILAGGRLQDQELAIVQVSRHIKDLWVFADSATAERLPQQMATSRAKDMAHDVMRENEQRSRTLERVR